MKTILRTQTEINLTNLKTELEDSNQIGSKFDHIQKYTPDTGDLEIVFQDSYDDAESSLDETELDTLLSNHDNTDIEFIIHSMVDEPMKSFSPHNIDYKRQITSGLKLHPIFEFDITGLLTKTTYYKDYVDAQNLGVEVLKVESNYVVDTNEPIKAAASVESRQTTRSWKLSNGKYSKKTKVTDKLYDTRDKKNNEGEKRRKNLRRITEDKMGTALVLTGQAVDPTDAEEKLTSFFETYSSAFYTWDASGKGSIYDDIDNDSVYVWMDAIVPDIPYTQALIPEAIGKTIREYSRDKLKGII